MTELSLWLILAVLTPNCLKKATATYEACKKAAVQGSYCAAPQELQGASLSLGRPVLTMPQGFPEECLEIRAVKVSGKGKPYNLKNWNKQADSTFRSLATITR